MKLTLRLIASNTYFGVLSKEEIISFFNNYFLQNEYNEFVDALINSNDDESIDDILQQVLISLGQSIPEENIAAIDCAKYIAAKVIEGHLDFIEGAKAICFEIEMKMTSDTEASDLKIFSTLLSEMEDFQSDENIDFYGQERCKKEVERIEQDIRANLLKVINIK